MSEQQPDPTLIEDTAVTPQDNWEQRYKDAQAWGTRQAQERAQYETAAQELERLRSDPDAQREFLAGLGYQVEEDEPQYPDPTEDLRKEIADLKAWRDSSTQEAQKAAEFQRDVEHVGQGLAAAQAQIGRELTEDEVAILAAAANSSRNEAGLPDIEGVTKRFLAVREHDQKTWVKGKKAPHVSVSGQPGTDTPDLLSMSDDERQKWMLSQLEE